jgi:hypothetical protein
MSRLNILAATVLSASLLAAGSAQAIQIQLWAHLSAKDEQDYMDQLVEGAQKVLIETGKQTDAAKVHQLFTFIHRAMPCR